MLKLDYLFMQQKTDLKKATGIDMSHLALNWNLAKLKVEVYKIDVDN